MPTPLLQLAYMSSAVREMDGAELVALLDRARAFNRSHGISGLLVYLQGNFLQILEGETEAVMPLLRRIAADPRHRGVITVMKRPIAERAFADWSMGFKGTADLSAAEQRAFTLLIATLAAPDAPVTDDPSISTLVKTFVVNNR